jgi:hypothetical protein
MKAKSRKERAAKEFISKTISPYHCPPGERGLIISPSLRGGDEGEGDSCSNPPSPPFSKGRKGVLLLIALCSLLYALCLFGCGYTLLSRTDLPFDSVQIEGIENRTIEPKLQDKFYNAITEEFLRYGVNVLSRADYKLSGTINRYELHVLSERRDVAVEYEVIIRGDFRLVGPSGETREIKDIGSPFIVSFPVSGALENALAFKELASQQAIRDMAMEVAAALIFQMR